MSGFETLAGRLGTRLRWHGDKLGADGLCCPVCDEKKLGIHDKPHPDSEGSDRIQVAFCFGCGSTLKEVAPAVGMTFAEVTTGNFGLLARYRRPSPPPMPTTEDVEGWHRDLLAQPRRLAYVTRRRGLSMDVLRCNLIGHDGERYTIPVRDHDAPGAPVVNVRRYLPNAPEGVPKIRSTTGAGAQLYGPVPDGTWLVVCEGEWDKLCALSAGVPTITNTAGASTWKDEWSERIGQRHVCVVYDRDHGGELGEARVRESFERVGKHLSLTIVRLPFPYRDKGGADLSDYLADHTRADLMTLLRSSYKSQNARNPGRGRDPHRARPIATAKRRSEVGS